MGLYKVAGEEPVCEVMPGELLEHDFTAREEADYVGSGLLEIEPRPYKVVGTAVAFGTKPGGTFTQALTVGQEHALISGGAIKRLALKKPVNTTAAARRQTRRSK